MQDQDRIGGFCLSGMMGKGDGRLLLHFLLTSNAPLWFLQDGRRQDGPLDWMSWSGFTISSTTVPWKSTSRGRRGTRTEEEERDVQTQAQAQAQQDDGARGCRSRQWRRVFMQQK